MAAAQSQATNIINAGAVPASESLTWITQNGIVYNLYRNDGHGGPIDYTNPIATTSNLTWTSEPLPFPSNWKFGVRAAQLADNLEEKNLDTATSLMLDASGFDISRCPPAPSGLRTFPRAAGVIRVEWGYHQINRSRLPDGFRIYLGIGAQPDYSSPVASVAHVLAQTSYASDLTGLTPGKTYSIGVRAFNGSGEETNTTTSLATSDATGPDGVDTLTATPTATQGD